jgi:hypothetical protein
MTHIRGPPQELQWTGNLQTAALYMHPQSQPLQTETAPHDAYCTRADMPTN